jgi:hypothetical protein
LLKEESMSGSSSNRPWRPKVRPVTGPEKEGGGGGGGATPDACNIRETTPLNSVNRTVITGLRAGDRLAVVFEPGPPQRLVARTAADVVAGSITSASMLQIIRCILQEGVEYEAEVLSVRGASCMVRVQPK